jgi:hypothetical protein
VIVGSRLPRLVRGAATAALATFVALFGHVAGGGDVPRFLGLVAPLVLSVLVCTLLAGRRLSVTRLAVSVVAAQALFHLLFTIGSSTRAGVATVADAVGHHQQVAVGAGQAVTATAHQHSTPLMLLGHAIAALITIAILVFGERLVKSLVTLARRFARWLAPFGDQVTPGSVILRLAASGIVDAPLRHLTDLSGASRRGPPHLAS